MSKVTFIETIEDKRLAPYSSLTESQLRSHENLFIAESPKVILSALESGYSPVSLLCEEKHIEGDASPIIEKCPDLEIYTSSRELLKSLTGYTLTRGVLCAMKRPAALSAKEILGRFQGRSRVAVIDGVCDTTNIGSIFRSAAAIGIDAIMLSPDACDPLNRRVVRVSMGSVFKIPWAFFENNDYIPELKSEGYKSVAMALCDESTLLDSSDLKNENKLAIILGGEGYGLSKITIEKSDYKVCIPMSRGIDSLNVGVAAGIAFWNLR